MKGRFNQIRNTLLGLLTASAFLTHGQEIKLTIENVKDEVGTLWVALYNSEDQFMKTRFQSLKLTPQKGQVVGVFQDVPPGIYAVSVIHDTNNNRELDKNAFGIPKEGFGFSNNAMGTFGPPDFKDTSFEYPDKKEIVIKLKYM